MAGSELTDADFDLIAEARAARDHSYAPYSKYRVGAALRTADGTVIRGCNVENVVLGETVCAEKVAIVKAVSDGLEGFVAVAIETQSSPPAPPCGSCRQMLFGWGVKRVLLANPQGEKLVFSIEELLPAAFALRELPGAG